VQINSVRRKDREILGGMVTPEPGVSGQRRFEMLEDIQSRLLEPFHWSGYIHEKQGAWPWGVVLLVSVTVSRSFLPDPRPTPVSLKHMTSGICYTTVVSTIHKSFGQPLPY
jgi:hypothetical protein